MNLYILHNVREYCFYTLWHLLVIGICVIVVPSAKPKGSPIPYAVSETNLHDNFLLLALQAFFSHERQAAFVSVYRIEAARET